ncbi:MAG TPA: acyl-CoA dehydrogenase family protein [Nitriliruptorales bacterium]|nr:acyl-CoA dehydrogenase family protein [Nitriliruptorales bacterium]
MVPCPRRRSRRHGQGASQRPTNGRCDRLRRGPRSAPLITSPFTPEHDRLRAALRRFVEEELAPHADEWEQLGRFPDEVFRRMGSLGFLGLTVPEDYGGQGRDYWSTVVLAEELARSGNGGVAMAIIVHTDMAPTPIVRFGTEQQKRDYLEPAVRGTRIACLGITEPEAGSDVAGIRTRAVRGRDGWVINGSKTFITNGVRADFCTMAVRTSGSPADGHDGLSLFLVDTDLPGYHVTRELDKLGMRSSDTAELHLEDVHVPERALLGAEGQGFQQIMWELQGERLLAAVQAVATAQLTFERTVEHVRARDARERSRGGSDARRHRLVDVATAIEACRRLVYDCADRWNRGVDATLEIAMCKLASARTSQQVAQEALSLHADDGGLEGSPIERAWRDARLLRIAGGTDEVQREIIARSMGL